MEKIKQVFDGLFERWSIQLPEEDLQARAAGAIHQNGWTIRYHFGNEGGREFLEYFASHRMTNDTLNRIYAGGEKQVVGFCDEFYVAGDRAQLRSILAGEPAIDDPLGGCVRNAAEFERFCTERQAWLAELIKEVSYAVSQFE